MLAFCCAWTTELTDTLIAATQHATRTRRRRWAAASLINAPNNPHATIIGYLPIGTGCEPFSVSDIARPAVNCWRTEGRTGGDQNCPHVVCLLDRRPRVTRGRSLELFEPGNAARCFTRRLDGDADFGDIRSRRNATTGSN